MFWPNSKEFWPPNQSNQILPAQIRMHPHRHVCIDMSLEELRGCLVLFSHSVEFQCLLNCSLREFAENRRRKKRLRRGHMKGNNDYKINNDKVQKNTWFFFGRTRVLRNRSSAKRILGSLQRGDIFQVWLKLLSPFADYLMFCFQTRDTVSRL